MTSPLHRKRPITAPSMPGATKPNGRARCADLCLVAVAFSFVMGPVFRVSAADQWTSPHRRSVRSSQPTNSGWRSTHGLPNRSSLFKNSGPNRPANAQQSGPFARKSTGTGRPVSHAEPIEQDGAGPDLLPAPSEDRSLDSFDTTVFDTSTLPPTSASGFPELPSPRETNRLEPSYDRDAPSLPNLLPTPSGSNADVGDSRDDEAAALRKEHQDDCRKSLTALRGKRLSDISLDISVDGTPGTDYPRACATGLTRVPLADLKLGEREQIDFAWTASGLCHKPLYFEETNLERYGQTAGPIVQPIASAAHFFATLPVLPYKMGLKPPGECVYTLGHYRPGDCAPHYIPAVPLSLRAGLVQAGAMVGAAAILP